MWLDVGFDAVQVQTTKHERQHRCQRFLHVAALRKWHTDVVPEICTPELPADYLAQLNSSHDRTIAVAHNEPAARLWTATAAQPGMEGGSASWRRCEASMEAFATSTKRDVLRCISCSWRA